MAKKTALVLGAGGFIGNHMVNRLKSEGYWVRGVDIKRPEYDKSAADHFVIRDLRHQRARSCCYSQISLAFSGLIPMIVVPVSKSLTLTRD